MLQMFDKQLTVRMGQANVRRWVDDLLPLVTDDDPLGVHDLATHQVPLAEAPAAYEMFQKKATAPSRSCSSPDRGAGARVAQLRLPEAEEAVLVVTDLVEVQVVVAGVDVLAHAPTSSPRCRDRTGRSRSRGRR